MPQRAGTMLGMGRTVGAQGTRRLRAHADQGGRRAPAVRGAPERPAARDVRRPAWRRPTAWCSRRRSTTSRSASAIAASARLRARMDRGDDERASRDASSSRTRASPAPRLAEPIRVARLPVRPEHRARRRRSRRALYNDPVYLELERERIFARTWQLVGRVGRRARARPVLHGADRRRPDRRAARRRHAARLPQRVPAPRRPGRVGLRQAQHAAVPLSRLDLRARRHAASARRRWRASQRFDAGRDAPRAGAGGDVGPARVREPRRQGAAAARRARRTFRRASRRSAASRCAT